MGRTQLVYKRHSFPWHGHAASPGLAARAGERTGGFYLGKQASGFFRVVLITAIGPFSGLLELYDKLQIKLILIPSSLPASFQSSYLRPEHLCLQLQHPGQFRSEVSTWSSPSIDPVLLLSKNRRSGQSGMHVGALSTQACASNVNAFSIHGKI